jgi:hypothetical protein
VLKRLKIGENPISVIMKTREIVSSWTTRRGEIMTLLTEEMKFTRKCETV